MAVQRPDSSQLSLGAGPELRQRPDRAQPGQRAGAQPGQGIVQRPDRAQPGQGTVQRPDRAQPGGQRPDMTEPASQSTDRVVLVTRPAGPDHSPAVGGAGGGHPEELSLLIGSPGVAKRSELFGYNPVVLPAPIQDRQGAGTGLEHRVQPGLGDTGSNFESQVGK